MNKSDSIRGPCGTRNEQLEQNPSSKVSKVSVKTSRSMGEREKQLEEGQRVSLPRLKTEYGNKSEAGRKGKVSQVSSRCTYVAYVRVIIGVYEERQGCTCVKQNPMHGRSVDVSFAGPRSSSFRWSNRVHRYECR